MALLYILSVPTIALVPVAAFFLGQQAKRKDH